MPYMARSDTAVQILLPTLNIRSSAVIATAGAIASLAGSTMVGVNSSTATATSKGSLRYRHIQRVIRNHTSRQPNAAKA